MIEFTEFDEQMVHGREAAITLLRDKAQEYCRGDESMGVLSAYERAAVLAGHLTWGEADETIHQAMQAYRATQTPAPSPEAP